MTALLTELKIRARLQVNARRRDLAPLGQDTQQDPVPRLRTYLMAQGLWSEDEEKAWADDCGKRVDEEINAYLNTPVQPVEAMFDYLYADPPPDLLEQRAAALALEGRS